LYGLTQRSSLRVTTSNFVEISGAVAEIWRFNGFQNGSHPPSSIFKKVLNLMADRVQRSIRIAVPHFAGDRRDRSSRFFSDLRITAVRAPSWVVESLKF